MSKQKKDNHIVVDLRHVQYARFYYENQYGHKLNIIPSNKDEMIRIGKFNFHGGEVTPFTCKGIFSVRNEWHCRCETRYGGNSQLLYDYAKERGLLDVWTPTLYMQLTANHSLIYTGDRALSLWEAWKARQFGKKKQ